MTSNENSTFLVMTADIVASRSLSPAQREAVAQRLTLLDEKLKPVIPAALYAGDEIQALFRTDEQHHPYWLVFAMTALFYPMKLRFGFGAGTVAEPINPNIALNSGAAYLKARAALDQTRDKDTIAFFQADDKFPVAEINAMFFLLSALTRKWNEKQWRRFFLYAKYGSIYQVATFEKVSAESINKSLKTASVRTILESLSPFKPDDVLSTIVVDYDKYQP